ncbi:hypothetical protein B0H14DRAFT_2634219 [Mycena olivaceomarginata]|nr:hypothetical protein B0H14DRAFT_2634219 [Mycena olivaceomarginata]
MALPSIFTNFAPNASTCSAATKPSCLRAHRAKSPCTGESNPSNPVYCSRKNAQWRTGRLTRLNARPRRLIASLMSRRRVAHTVPHEGNRPPRTRRDACVPGAAIGDDFEDEFCARGKVQFGDNLYGCVRVGLHVAYGPHLYAPTAVVQQMIHFSINKDLARENIVLQERWLLLREYIKLGARMRLCCGRVASMEDVCCCGGWAHDEEKRVRFRLPACPSAHFLTILQKVFLNIGK